MTGRLPFDPKKMASATAAKEDAAPVNVVGNTNIAGPISVSQLAARINSALDSAFPATVKVVGEISNFSLRTHWYFSIKDAASSLSCVMFAGRAKGAGFTPASGQQVVITARVEMYEPSGRLTLNVEKIEPVGAGALELQLRALIAEIKALGWMEAQRKRPLPMFPRRVAVITSKKGAALADVLATMNARCPAVEVCLIDVLVQGTGAVPSIVEALSFLNLHGQALGIEVILLTRGGGSIEDLWAFNDRAIAEAIVHSSIPVVCAIGHETDTTIAELVADLRSSTPTQAAMAICPDRSALHEQRLALTRRLYQGVRRTIVHNAQLLASVSSQLGSSQREFFSNRARNLTNLSARLERGRPAAIYAQRSSRLAMLTNRLVLAQQHRLRAEQTYIDQHARAMPKLILRSLQQVRQVLDLQTRQLGLVGPVEVLRRGYSITTNAHGQVIREPGQVVGGDRLITRLAEGQITSTVGTALPAPLPIAAPRRRKPPKDDGTLSLF
jgi:exodeoxyribonuclease VII large subunit